MIGTVSIVGVGLIGGSFGLALKNAGFAGKILGVSSERSTGAALAIGAIDEAAGLEEAAGRSDLIFLSQPVEAIVRTIALLNDYVQPHALVTDAGSTKRVIANAARQSLTNAQFLGGHPMAGKEVRGAEAADTDLFRNRTWVLTGSIGSPVEIEFRRWLQKIGAKELLLEAEEHDRLVAWSSHLPQLASTALAATLHDYAPDAAKVAGPGLLDSTRLALSSYDLWREILDTNPDQIDLALSAYIARLQELKTDIANEFAKGAAFARKIREG